MPHHLPGAVVAECRNLRRLDPAEAMAFRQLVEHADEEGKRIRQRPVEIEDC